MKSRHFLQALDRVILHIGAITRDVLDSAILTVFPDYAIVLNADDANAWKCILSGIKANGDDYYVIH